jgi:DNA invertase Pin-like site-specific DNA recombinase
MKAYGYARVSTARQAEEGLSLGTQQRQIEGYAQMRGLPVERLFVEEGVSGSVPLGERPEGRKLLAALKPGDALIAAKLDRAFRSALDALQVVRDLTRKGVALHLLDLGGDVTNGHGKLFMTIVAAFAEAERDRIRERISDVKRDQRRQGRYLGGIVPFGFRPGPDGALEPVPAEQAVIVRVRELRQAGKPLRAIRAAVEGDFGRKLSLDALSRLVKAEGA